MKFSLVFENTNDEIVYKSCQDEVVNWFIHWLDSQQLNLFRPRAGIDYWTRSLEDFDSIVAWYQRSGLNELINTPLAQRNIEDYMDQSLLNAYHATWVKLHKVQIDINQLREQHTQTDLVKQILNQYPDGTSIVSFADVLKTLDYTKSFLSINTHLHRIEQSADRSIICISQASIDDDCFIQNPFEKSILTTDDAHLRITGSHLGRTLMNKYVNRDDDLLANDENTFDEISPKVDIKLGRQQDVPLSQVYRDWCHRNNRDPIGYRLNLGNIVDLEQHLLYYRKMFYRNLTQDNGFSLIRH